MSAGSQGDPNRQAWVEQVGTYYYYALILGEFDPIRADRIFDQPAHVIAEAYVSKMAYQYVKPKPRDGRTR
jgi:hypothetical protein